ncbi:hypothetical protein N665_0867s0007 [Sinapis alba]|nr:hypothetical protein N665_0867s0007 [Sinapis alba]
MQSTGKSSVSASADPRNRSNQSHAVACKPNGKSPVSSFNDHEAMLFKDLSLAPHESELRFRLIHFWEARVPIKNTLIGLEMILIDEEGAVIQGFVPPGRIKKYLPELRQGSLYSLFNFYGSKSKFLYRVASASVTVSFSHNSELKVLENSHVPFEDDRFRFHTYDDFESNSDLRGDLYDVVGHLKVVNGQPLSVRPFVDEVEVATTRRMLVHVQTYEGPVMKLYLWDQAAIDFCSKFNSSESTPIVVLVTTVNPKRLGGTLALSSMSSSRVFIDHDVSPTRDYLTWLSSNPEIADKVNAEVVTKPETLTIAEIFSYIDQPDAKAALFECTATIDDVVHGSAWYYIGCGGCKTKAIKGATSLMCPKCEKDGIAGEPQYRARISVYDRSEQAIFVLLGDAGRELFGKHASELVSGYFEANGHKGADFQVPVPQPLLNAIGQTHKFSVKVTAHNLTGKTRALTVTKVLPPAGPPSIQASEENIIAGGSDDSLVAGDGVCESSKGYEGAAEEGVNKSCDIVEPGKAKRPRRET